MVWTLTIFEKEDSNAKAKMADIVLVNLALKIAT